MKLTRPTDDQLSEAVAEHVAGWMWRDERGGAWFIKSIDPDPLKWVRVRGPNGGDIALDGGLQFAASADAVLPLLGKWRWFVETSWCTGSPGSPFPPVPTHIWVKIFVSEQWLPPFPFPKEPTRGYNDPFVWAGNGPFARTACIALLRAHGHEVID